MTLTELPLLAPLLALFTGLPLITLLITIPLIGATLSLLAPPTAARRITRLTATLNLALALITLAHYDPAYPAPQLVEHAPWIPTLTAAWHVGLDPLSALFIPLTAAITLIATLAEHRPRHLALLLLLQAPLIGIYTALDAILFFACWEAILIPILLAGLLPTTTPATATTTPTTTPPTPDPTPHPAAHRITGRAITTLLIGGTPLLIALALLITATGTTNLTTLTTHPPAITTQRPALACILLALAIKAPLWPFHGWLPRLLTAGPIGIALLIIAFKTGIWALLRLTPLCPDAFTEATPLLIPLALTSALWAALIALRQRDLRHLTAWTTIAHAGLITAAIATGTPGAREAALFDLLTAALTATALLHLADQVERRYGAGDLATTGGLARTTPRLATAILFFALAALGLPLTGGFIAEILIFTTLAHYHPLALTLALLTIPLLATATARTLRDLLGGPPRRPAPDLNATPARLTLTLALATLLLGTLPTPILTHLRPPPLPDPRPAHHATATAPLPTPPADAAMPPSP